MSTTDKYFPPKNCVRVNFQARRLVNHDKGSVKVAIHLQRKKSRDHLF